MANLKVVDADVLDAGLTRVADKVREKAGTSEMLVFPDGYESALDSIESADDALAEVEYMMSNGYTDYSCMFYKLEQMTEAPTGILQHIENGISFDSMFYDCTSLEEVPVLNTRNAVNHYYMFRNCSRLHTIGGIDFSKSSNVASTFYSCSALENITFYGTIKSIGLDLSPCSSLTHDSLMSAINALYDYASEGSTLDPYFRIGTTNLAKLTEDEKYIATSKGWTLS